MTPITLSRSMTCLGMSTSVNESSGPETILPFMYIMPPEPKTELCETKKISYYSKLRSNKKERKKIKRKIKEKVMFE